MSRRCDYYFLCDARIQESLSEGERGRPDCRKTTATTLFLIFNPQLILQFCRGVQHFSGGFNFFQGGGGGGGPDAYFHKNAYNL